MGKYKNYTGIDFFRLIAAILIITIHTSPLASFSATGDFILTRIVARVAVPFFFMTSGFFLISRYSRDNDKLKKFVNKTACIYGIAILIYIPVNIYNGYFNSDNLIPNILKDLFFDGTIYHLWYLPASIFGAWIAWYLVKHFDYKRALIMSSILYLIGFFGDSYYGITEKISGLNSFYQFVFQVSDYTRNGVFFAPLFFILGGFIADTHHKISFRNSFLGCGISFALMLAEAMLLHYLDLQRHDSMYVFLLPCMYFLFHAILHFQGKRLVWMRTLSLCIYIIHPMMIIAVRLLAKVAHLQNLLIENSMLHFLMVCFTSVAVSIVATALLEDISRKNKKPVSNTDRAWIEVDLKNLAHNAKVLKKAMPPKCQLMAVVKAEAYGHRAFEISTCLEKIGVKAFAVATIDEGIRLRKYGIRGEILILGYTAIWRAAELKKYDLIQTLISYDYAIALNKQGVSIKAHLKIDTGMHRLGISSDDLTDVEKVFSLKHITVCGIYTHLCCSDSLEANDVAFTCEQINRFYSLIDALRNRGIIVPKLHIQSSYGFFNYPQLQCDYVRTGVALYGVLSSPHDETVRKLDLRPVLSLKSEVILIRSVPKGDSVGYGRTFTAQKDSRIAIIPIGYADGIPRNLSCGNGRIRIRQYIVPIIGRICMDQLAVDITEAEDIVVGDVATFIEAKAESELAAPVVADQTGSISNELLCRIGARLPVIEK